MYFHGDSQYDVNVRKKVAYYLVDTGSTLFIPTHLVEEYNLQTTREKKKRILSKTSQSHFNS